MTHASILTPSPKIRNYTDPTLIAQQGVVLALVEAERAAIQPRTALAESFTLRGQPGHPVSHMGAFSREREDVREARLAYGNRFSVCAAHAQWVERQPGVTVQAVGP